MFTIKPGDDNIVKSMRMPRRLVQRVDTLAEKYHLSFTDLVMQCIEYALDSMSGDGKDIEKALPENNL